MIKPTTGDTPVPPAEGQAPLHTLLGARKGVSGKAEGLMKTYAARVTGRPMAYGAPVL